jgi:hypothetical protein
VSLRRMSWADEYCAGCNATPEVGMKYNEIVILILEE